MKKLIVVLSLFIMSICFVACNSCKKQKDVINEKTTAELVVERVYNADKQYMFTNYGEDNRWFESCILLKDYLDSECDGTVAGISNVFQVISDNDGKSADVSVVLVAHTADSTVYDVRHGFWVEDFPLNDAEIKLTYTEAFEKIQQVNLPKPHSKNCVLRMPIGPKQCNAQYVFGNVQAQLWVDAVTGEVRESNPAFPDGDGFKMPLGEWP